MANIIRVGGSGAKEKVGNKYYLFKDGALQNGVTITHSNQNYNSSMSGGYSIENSLLKVYRNGASETRIKFNYAFNLNGTYRRLGIKYKSINTSQYTYFRQQISADVDNFSSLESVTKANDETIYTEIVNTFGTDVYYVYLRATSGIASTSNSITAYIEEIWLEEYPQ